MRATDIVRQVLDLLDELEGPHDIVEPTCDDQEEYRGKPEQGEPVASRFKQIFDLLNQNGAVPGSDATTNPDEQYAGIEAVTTLAGGGVNGPKHPDDIRVKDPRGYE